MPTNLVAWPSIELLHNAVRTLGHLHELGEPFPVVTYRAKVKLHGSNWLGAIGGVRDPKLTGAFLAWMATDVQKESVAELEASGLTWSQVDRAVAVAARTWFLAK